MFREYKGLDLVGIADEVLDRWRREGTFRRSLEVREGAPEFIFHEGPPSANGMPGIHHVMARSIKDSICRYKTQSGYRVRRRAGWDTHGLPVELGVEKSLGITKEDIGRKISVDEYNRACRSEVMKYTKEWVSLTERIGYWVDTDDPYITYDNRYIETLWYLLKDIYGKGLLYKGFTIQPYSPAAGTGLSSHELIQPGCYRDVKDTTATAVFRMLDPRPEMTEWGRPAFIAWTTTPWTLPSNTALCVGPNIEYVAAQTFNPYSGERLTIVLAEALVPSYLKGTRYETLAEMEALDVEKVDGRQLPYRIVGHYRGSDLVGMRYSQLMPWVKPCAKIDDLASAEVRKYAEEHPDRCFTCGQDSFVELSDMAFRVIPGDYVTTDDGTGIVHIAPTFGADDAKVAKAAGVPSLFMINRLSETRPMVDATGKYCLLDECDEAFVRACVNVEGYRAHEGAYVKNAYDPRYNVGGKYDADAAAKDDDLNVLMSIEMKKAGDAFRVEKHVHNYPHCWRTDKPVLYYPLDSWFIRTTAVREKMMELNDTIDWKPESTGTGRFGKWLENIQDWNLSRSRYWGTPLPIWRTADSKEEKCIGSAAELYSEIEKAVEAGFMESNPLRKKGFVPGDMSKENYDRIDLHRPYVDNIFLVSDSGRKMTRETDLIDVWFDSGAMPYAQEGLRNLDSPLFGCTADFIAEGVDQTRGWFYTLHAINTMVSGKCAFRRVISNGLVLDKDGNKMSKRLGNAVDPFKCLDQFGPDALRFYMLTNSQPWDNLRFDIGGVDEVRRKFFGTLYNTYSFFALYANVDGFDPSSERIPVERRPELDRWVISVLNTLVHDCVDRYENYDVTGAGRLIQDFVCDQLSNWYVRLGRKRFWGGGLTEDKTAAYQTLYEVLVAVSKLLAPIAPFFAERLYLDLVPGRESVHFEPMPEYCSAEVDRELEERMTLAQRASSMVLALRRKVNIKVRQPLSKLIIPVIDPSVKARLEQVKDLLLAEVNVKEAEFISETAGIITKKIKPNFKTLGKKYGRQMKEIAAAFPAFSQETISAIQEAEAAQKAYVLELAGGAVALEAGDYEISSEDMPGWLVATEGALTFALDITLTDELRNEGCARELINRIQNVRKDSGFALTDRVNVVIYAGGEALAEIGSCLPGFGAYIAQQTLSDSVTAEDIASAPEDAAAADWNETEIRLSVKIS